jgi:hypothetical protein
MIPETDLVAPLILEKQTRDERGQSFMLDNYELC